MKIAFYQPHLCLRGTTVAMFDYAYYNQTLLNNKSIIIYDTFNKNNDITSIERFKNNFDVFNINGFYEIDNILSSEKCDAVYIIKGGYNDGRVSKVCKNLIHCIAMAGEEHKHGEVYAYGSYWLAEVCSNNRLPAVPYMISLPDINENLRKELNIPDNAIVFGRNGGMDSWDIPFANECIRDILLKRDDVYFIFQNTPRFLNHKNVIHIPSTANMEYKVKFINTCDAMLHARYVGESFGLSCGEFSLRNKPIITYGNSKEKNHYFILKDKGIYYNNKEELDKILSNFKPNSSIDYNCYKDYNPEKIMSIFKNIFLD